MAPWRRQQETASRPLRAIMAIRTERMSIQRRILAGNLAVVGLLLVPAIYGVVRLELVGERTSRSLETGLETIRELERLRSEFETLEQLHRFSGAFSGDPEVQQKIEGSLDAARTTWTHLKPRLEETAGAPKLVQLDTLLRERPKAPPDSAGWDIIGPQVATGPVASPPPAPTTGTSPAGSHARSAPPLSTAPAAAAAAATAAAPPSAASEPFESWSEEVAYEVRAEISAADQLTRRRLLEGTAEIRRDAERAGRLGLAALCVTASLALLSTLLVVRGITVPLGRLAAATSAVAAGRFGIELPVDGSDELSDLARAFNTMSTSLAALDRMKADFVNVVAHELKTPLACIKGYAGALRASMPRGPSTQEADTYLDRIDREADLLARRVSELLTFGVIEAGQLQLERREVMTEGFVLMVAEAFRPIAAERRIEFDVAVERDVPPTFQGDPDRLNQVLLNLLDNAFKFTPPHGRVRLEGRVSDGMLELEVRDTGPGIPAGKLETIFEKYARVRSGEASGRGGTGLGLAVARGIVLAHGGTIDARSEQGGGSVFRVRLPIELAPAPARGQEVA